MPRLAEHLEQKLIAFATALVGRSRARPIINARQPKAGYWFGSGILVPLASGELAAVGRNRTRGDSRSGLAAGERGCEAAVFPELGGLAYYRDGDLGHIQRLSATGPLFVSPHATGCSRYVDFLRAHEQYYVSWQQAQPDQSQPVVLNVIAAHRAHESLSS